MTSRRLGSSGPLFRNLVRREVRQRYKGSVLGLGWTLLNPLILVVAYSVVFKFLFGSPIPNFALFMFVGLIVWTIFFGGITEAATSIVSNASLVTKVRFPRQIIPLASITANTVIAGAMLVIAVPLCIWLGSGSLVPLVAVPAFLALTMIAAVGIGLMLSALNVYFRDVEHILSAIATPLFFLTPIFYTYESLPPVAQQYGWLIDLLHWVNPISPFVITVQDTLFFGQWPPLADTLYCGVMAGVFLAIGWWAFGRLEREMAMEL
jgi:ABC-2 type transport system permease protein